MSNDDKKVDEALHDPDRVFANPQAVVEASDLSISARREILESWKTDAIALQRASNEAMTGGERDILPEIEAALKAVSALNRAGRSELA